MLEGSRSSTWKWYICILLLLATVVNYMDRLTANTLAVEIQHEFKLSDEQYGHLELGFGLAFAAGSLLFGWLVDRVGVYWLYPVVLVGWSTMGFFTGLSQSYGELLVLRILLGMFEAGHFPCGLKTVQLLLAPVDRTMGNSLLQSGTALGAIIAPQVIKAMLTPDPESWRLPFMVIGAGGCVWIVFWLLSIRPKDLRPAEPALVAEPLRDGHRNFEGFVETSPPDTLIAEPLGERRPGYLSFVFSAKFLALAIMVICINLNWHLFRVWLPKFLREARGYSRDDMLNFTTMYYIAADVGVLTAGAVSSWLARHGMSVNSARISVFGCCCLMTTMTTAAAFLPAGHLLMASLLMVAFGGLGSFAAFYSMTQDLSNEHQGKISGTLSTITWLVTAAFHPIFGRYLDQTKKYDVVVGAMGWLPLIALVAILLLWNRTPRPAPVEPVAPL